MLALILTRKLRPMIIGSLSGWLMLAGMMARPRAISSRTNSGVMNFGMLAPNDSPACCFSRQRIAHRVQALVLADGDVFHLRRDDALARVVHLADVGAGLGHARQGAGGKAHRVQARIGFAATTEFGTQLRQQLGVAALLDPLRAQRRQAGRQVDARVRIGVRAGRVVDGDRRILFAAEQRRRLRLRRSRASRTCRSGREPCTKILREPGIGRVTDSESWSVCCNSEEGTAFMAFVLRNAGRSGGARTARRSRGSWASCEASLRRSQPDQVRRVCLNRCPIGPAIPPLRGELDHKPAGVASRRRIGSQGSMRWA